MPFLGKTPSQIVDPEVDIDGGTIDGVSIGSVTANAGAFTNLTATGTLTLPDDGISGDDVNGGTISNFASTGIDDNATSTALTVTDSGIAATLTTAAQPNITSVGTLSALSVTGDLTVDTDTLVVDATNNHVKIGDTAATPDGVLSIRSDSDAHAISIYEPAGANENWQIGVNASGDLQFYDSGQTVSKVTFQDGGDVGIGTTTTTGIQANLHIHSSSTDNGDGDGQVNFGDECSVIISTNAASAGGQGYYGSLFFGGQDITSATQQVWKLAGLSAYSSADLGTTASADLLFYTTSSSATPTERMRIASSGDVGIGTNDPDSKLDVRGTVLGGADSPSTGQIAFGVQYQGSTNIANTYGTMKSSAATCIGWGVYGSPSVIDGFASSVDTSLNFRRGALLVDQDELRFFNAGQQTVARDAAVTMTERFKVDASGRLMLNITSSSIQAPVRAQAFGASSSYFGYYFDAAGTVLSYVRGDGLFGTGVGSLSPYNYSTTGRDVYVNSSGQLGYVSSIREAKENIQPIEDVGWLYSLSPVSFNYKEKDDEGRFTSEVNEEVEYGLIADEVEQVNANLCFYDENEEGDKSLAGVSYRKLIPVLTKAIQEQQAIIEDLQTRLSALEAN